MDVKVNFLERYNLSKLTQEETDILNRPIINKEIEIVFKNYPKRKTQEHMTFLVNSNKDFKKN